MEHLRRYAGLVDDLDAFLEAAVTPLPRIVWANPLRGVEPGRAAVARAHPGATPLGWLPDAWRLPHDARPGTWPEYVLGHLHAQEEASVWAGDVLGAQPGDSVLDLCAAPGGKSARLAVGMRDQGSLVANDRRLGRLAALRRTLERLGVTCAVVTRKDGLRLRSETRFDRVFVDAPCSCEGNTRKSAGARERRDEPGHRRSVVQVQTGLLRRAIQLTRPGGVLVYATCTYAPEENEAVLDAAPREGEVAIESVTPPPGWTVAPGTTEWEGRVFRPDVAHAARIWPHHNDTGGFFVARLRRL